MKRQSIVVMIILLTLIFLNLTTVKANIYLDDGLVHNISSQFPHGNVYIDYQAPGMGTTINLLPGGRISGSPIRAYNDCNFNMLGGLIDASGNLYAYDNTQITFSSGAITNGGLFLYDNTETTFSGGSMTNLGTNQNSMLSMFGGTITQQLMVDGSSEATVSGGAIGIRLVAGGSSLLTITGGDLGYSTTSSEILATGSSVVTLIGSNFAVNGQDIGYGILTSISGSTYGDEPWRHLSGTLLSGDDFSMFFKIAYDAKIVTIPAPSALILVIIGLGCSSWKLRKHKEC